MGKIIQDSQNKNHIQKLLDIKDDNKWLNLIIIWDVGVGKTFLATNLLPHDLFVSELKFKVELTTWNLRLAKPEEYHSKNSFLLEQMIRKNTIIYDDYWTCALTTVYVERMIFWIDERMKKRKRTIFTTNLSRENFENREKRISSRMLQDSIIMIMTWIDRRKSNIRIM